MTILCVHLFVLHFVRFSIPLFVLLLFFLLFIILIRTWDVETFLYFSVVSFYLRIPTSFLSFSLFIFLPGISAPFLFLPFLLSIVHTRSSGVSMLRTSAFSIRNQGHVLRLCAALRSGDDVSGPDVVNVHWFYRGWHEANTYHMPSNDFMLIQHNLLHLLGKEADPAIEVCYLFGQWQ